MSLKRLLLSAANRRLARIERLLDNGTRPQERAMPRKKSPVPRPKHVKPHDLIIRKLKIR